ncbi:hypothetical protein [Micromonospora coxensis]|uniref:RiboL-PSP-HEPN domain-containing protein n=1 Tax=Micromonospora coxensis TaxID=356852 RepID=A0A1C5IYT8_9ACTN|nr:hypothetical protein [Micromonospora coxensis]SCG63474.1 hypothetical protein GA0070614_3651 [Micromonospora coxensis]
MSPHDASSEASTAQDSAVEPWAEAILRFIDYGIEVDALIEMHLSGLGHAKKFPQLLEITNPTPDALTIARRRADIALKIEVSGSHLMYAHCLLGLWSALEAMVEDLAGAWMKAVPEVLERAAFSKVRIPLAEFTRLSEDDRIRLLISEAQRDLRTELASGVTRFERLLEAVGLDGAVDADVRKTIFEMWQSRNILAHRAGICDRKFTDSCPWLDYQPGDKLRIDAERFERYNQALMSYSLALFNRCRKHFNLSLIEAAAPVPSVPNQAERNSHR